MSDVRFAGTSVDSMPLGHSTADTTPPPYPPPRRSAPLLDLTPAESLIVSRVCLIEGNLREHNINLRINYDGSLVHEYTRPVAVQRKPRFPDEPIERRYRPKNPCNMSSSPKDWLQAEQCKKINEKWDRLDSFRSRQSSVQNALWAERNHVEVKLADLMRQDIETQSHTVGTRATLQKRLMALDWRLNNQGYQVARLIQLPAQLEVHATQHTQLNPDEASVRDVLQRQLALLNLESPVFAMDEDQAEERAGDDEDGDEERAHTLDAEDEDVNSPEGGLFAVPLRMSRTRVIKPTSQTNDTSNDSKGADLDVIINIKTAIQEPKPKTPSKLPRLISKLQQKVQSSARQPCAGCEAHIEK